MARRTLDALMDVLEELKQSGVTPDSKIAWPAIVTIIKRKVGSDQRTVDNAVSLLHEFKLIVEIDGLCTIDFEKAYELML